MVGNNNNGELKTLQDEIQGILSNNQSSQDDEKAQKIIKAYESAVEKSVNTNPSLEDLVKEAIKQGSIALLNIPFAYPALLKIPFAYNNRGLTKSALAELQLNQADQITGFEKAITDYDEALKLNPNYTPAYNNRGNAKSALAKLQPTTELKKEWLEKAIKDFTKAIEFNPKFADAYYNRGNAKSALAKLQTTTELKEAKFKEAIRDYNKSIEINPNYADAYNNLGNAKSALAKLQPKKDDQITGFEDAITDYDEALKLNPNFAFAYNNRGSAKFNLAELQPTTELKKEWLEKAIEDCNEALKLDPNFAAAYHNRGSAKFNLAKLQPTTELKKEWLEKAIEDFTQAINKSKSSPSFFLQPYILKAQAHYELLTLAPSIEDFTTHKKAIDGLLSKINNNNNQPTGEVAIVYYWLRYNYYSLQAVSVQSLPPSNNTTSKGSIGRLCNWLKQLCEWLTGSESNSTYCLKSDSDYKNNRDYKKAEFYCIRLIKAYNDNSQTNQLTYFSASEQAQLASLVANPSQCTIEALIRVFELYYEAYKSHNQATKNWEFAQYQHLALLNQHLSHAIEHYLKQNQETKQNQEPLALSTKDLLKRIQLDYYAKVSLVLTGVITTSYQSANYIRNHLKQQELEQKRQDLFKKLLKLTQEHFNSLSKHHPKPKPLDLDFMLIYWHNQLAVLHGELNQLEFFRHHSTQAYDLLLTKRLLPSNHTDSNLKKNFQQLATSVIINYYKIQNYNNHHQKAEEALIELHRLTKAIYESSVGTSALDLLKQT